MPKYKTSKRSSSRVIQLSYEEKRGVNPLENQRLKFEAFVNNLSQQATAKQPDLNTLKIFTPKFSVSDTCLKKLASPLHASAQNAFEGVKEIYFSGGGGAGCAYPSAVKCAVDSGLDLSKVEVVCGASVGAIVALGIGIDAEADELIQILSNMPTTSFQDWNIWTIYKFLTTWGLCRGQAMPNYFKALLKEKTGIDDPTFKELYEAGYKKELRIVTTNISKGESKVFSYKSTPDEKVADIVSLSCAIPFVFPPKRIMNEEGSFDLHTDGAILRNFPWKAGGAQHCTDKERLGFAIANSITSTAMHTKKNGNSITNFREYMRYLFRLIVFEKTLMLTEEEMQRTVVIQVNYNPFDFSPSPPLLKYLEESSDAAVKAFTEKTNCEPSHKKQKVRCP